MNKKEKFFNDELKSTASNIVCANLIAFSTILSSNEVIHSLYLGSLFYSFVYFVVALIRRKSEINQNKYTTIKNIDKTSK